MESHPDAFVADAGRWASWSAGGRAAAWCHMRPRGARYLRARGYRFVTLEEALADPAYDTPDEYVGPTGISWLHRWRRTLQLEDRLRDEPDPPKWLLQTYGGLGG